MRRSVIGRMLRLAKSNQRMPRSLYVHGAEIEGSEPLRLGGLADVFIGRYQGQLVALKRYRHNALTGGNDQGVFDEVMCSSAVLSFLLNGLRIHSISIIPLLSGVNSDMQISCPSSGSTRIFSLHLATYALLALGCVVELSGNLSCLRISCRLETLIALCVVECFDGRLVLISWL
jgi:hypothetical protein